MPPGDKQTSAPRTRALHAAVKRSVDRILWTNARTGRRLQWIKHPDIPLKGASVEDPQLGLGLLDWDNHVKALQSKWILNYLDAVVGNRFWLRLWVRSLT